MGILLNVPGTDKVFEAPLIVIEHLESKPTRWLIAEYIESYEVARENGLDLVISRVHDPVLASLLDKNDIPYTYVSAREIGCSSPSIIMDLRAPRPLEPWESRVATCIVIGGIMGDYPPKARGLLLVHDLPGFSVRNLGPGQMSIHTATWAVAQVYSGKRVRDLKVGGPAVLWLESPFGEYSVELPFVYPLGRDGSPIVPKRVRDLLESGIMWDEEYL
ncbi:MAG: hypothetical protein GSR77_07950 [Desulfurococcales archaeon]|nr:hypothetical protein [Desulfurococcales archaeon]